MGNMRAMRSEVHSYKSDWVQDSRRILSNITVCS